MKQVILFKSGTYLQAENPLLSPRNTRDVDLRVD